MHRRFNTASGLGLLLLGLTNPWSEISSGVDRSFGEGPTRQQESLFAFTDSTFALSDWSHEIFVDINGGMAAGADVTQDATNGLPPPSRKIDRQFTCDSLVTMRMISASWATTSTYDPAGDSVESISYWFDYNAAGIAIHPLIVQSDTFFYAPRVLTDFPYEWEFFEMLELKEEDFAPFGLPALHPDFSKPMMFGYVSNTSSPPQKICPYRNYRTIWIDNFNVRVNGSEVTTENRSPRLVDDIMIARSYIESADELNHWGSVGYVEPLRNDFDPDGDPLTITDVGNPTVDYRGSPFGGANAGLIAPGRIEFSWLNPDSNQPSRDNSFTYSASDGINDQETANVHVLIDCACVIECYLQTGNALGKQEIDLAFIRRFRDEYMEATEHGARFVDLYYDDMPEMLWLLLVEKPELAVQAVEMVELIQPLLRNLVDGDGEMAVSQEQMDAIAAFADSLSLAASDSLKQAIADELARLGPLDQYAGQSVSSVASSVLGDLTNVGIEQDRTPETPSEYLLGQNYPNPFNPETTIPYSVPVDSDIRILLYDVAGRQISVLFEGRVSAGVHAIRVDVDPLPSGVYIYQLVTPDMTVSRSMNVLR